MDATRKSFEIQAHIRHNAEDFRNTLKDLYKWEKDIKDAEMMLHTQVEQASNIANEPIEADEAPMISSTTQMNKKMADAEKPSPPPIRTHLAQMELEKMKAQEANAKRLPGKQSLQQKDKRHVFSGPRSSTNSTSSSQSSNSSYGSSSSTSSIASAYNEDSTNATASGNISEMEYSKILDEANEIKNKGNRYVNSGDYEMALESYSMAIKLIDKEPIYYTNRALCYLKLARFNECIDDCDRAISLDSTAVKAYYRRMLANEELGNNIMALKDCESVLKQEPKNSDAKRSLERINDKLIKNAQKANGPNFTPLHSNLIEIEAVTKAPYKRSNQPMKRIPITDVLVNAGRTGNELQISDEDLDKIFNSHCESLEEVKPSPAPSSMTGAATALPMTPIITPMPTPTVSSISNTSPSSASNSSNNTSAASTSSPCSIVSPETIKSLMAINENLSEVGEEINMEMDSKENSPTTPFTGSSVVRKMTREEDDDMNNGNGDETNKKYRKEELEEDSSPKLVFKKQLPPVPEVPNQFYLAWKELNSEEKYLYLKSIPVQNLSRILGAGINSDVFYDIIFTLKNFYMQKLDPELGECLLQVCKNRHIKILASMLSIAEKNAVKSIINALETHYNLDVESMALIKNIFKF